MWKIYILYIQCVLAKELQISFLFALPYVEFNTLAAVRVCAALNLLVRSQKGQGQNCIYMFRSEEGQKQNCVYMFRSEEGQKQNCVYTLWPEEGQEGKKKNTNLENKQKY